MCVPFQTIPPPTQGTKKAVQMLQLLAICEFIVGLLKLFVLQSMSGFYEFFTIFILYMAWGQLNYCNCVVVVFFFLQNILMIFIFFGLNVELSVPFFYPTKAGVLNFIFFIYYIVACYIAFLAYKEFKIYQYDQMGGLIQQSAQAQGAWGAGNQDDAQQQQYQNQQQQYYTTNQQPQQSQQSQQENRQFSAFQGRGVQIG